MAPTTEGNPGTVRPHQPGQGVVKAILPEEIEWKPFAAFSPSVGLAVVGQPFENGPYTVRMKMPHDVKLMPHRHPEDRTYTVSSGIFYIGLGDQFDADKLVPYPAWCCDHPAWQHIPLSPGKVRRIRHAGDGGLEYINSKDDPRNDTPP